MKNLSDLRYLDLSNNQLDGEFPEWFHDQSRLQLLNLGQNNLSGEIPLVIGGRLNNLRMFLVNEREIERFGQEWSSAGYGDSYTEFLYPWMKRSNDLLWLDSCGNWKFAEIIHNYLRREANYLTSKVFESIRRDPVRMAEFFKSALKRH